MKQTNVTSIPLPTLTKANVYFNILQTHDSKSIDVLFYSSNHGKNNEYAFLCLEKGLERFDQTQLFQMNGTYSRRLILGSNLFQELPKINQLDVRELNIHSNHIKQLIDSSNLPKSIEVNRAYNIMVFKINSIFNSKSFNFYNNSIEYVKEDFFVPFLNLRYVNLNRNLLHSINTLYFNSDYLTDIQMVFNKLEIMDRFVFLNPNKMLLNDLNIKLDSNYLKRFPRFYGNVSNINKISMVNQNGFLTVIEDFFFDNSVSFKVDNNVKNIIW